MVTINLRVLATSLAVLGGILFLFSSKRTFATILIVPYVFLFLMKKVSMRRQYG